MSNEDNRTDVVLTNSEQELRLLVDTIPALVWAAGPEGDIEYVNKRVLDYLGTTFDEITGNGWLEKVHPDDARSKLRLGSRAMAGMPSKRRWVRDVLVKRAEVSRSDRDTASRARLLEH